MGQTTLDTMNPAAFFNQSGKATLITYTCTATPDAIIERIRKVMAKYPLFMEDYSVMIIIVNL